MKSLPSSLLQFTVLSSIFLNVESANAQSSPFADKPCDSYSSYKGADGKDATLLWGQAPLLDFGSRSVQFANPEIRQVNPVPAPGVHPRICFTAADLPDIRRRLKETHCGQQAWRNILCWTEMMKGKYDDKADYAKPDVWNGGFGGLHGPVPLFRIGVGGHNYNNNEMAAKAYSSLVDGTATDFPDYYWNTMALEAFRCLIEDDQAGGTTLAKAVVTALKIDQAKRAADPKFLKSGKPPAQPVGAFQLAFCYDFLFNWLTPDQKKAMHDELAEGTWSHDNYGTFNTAESSRSNWATFSYWLYEVLAIEGEPGFNDLKVRGMYRGWRDLLTYGWYQSGATFEGEAKNQLGMDGILMFSMREKAYGFNDLCRHPYLLAYADKFLPESINPMLTGFNKYDLLGGSRSGKGGATPCDFIGLKYMFPNDKVIDWVYRKSVGENYEGVPDRPDGYFNGLLFASIFCEDFDPANNDPAKLNLPNTFFCGERALMMTRSSWNPDAMMLNMHTRQANGGHPFADRNSIMVAGAGRIWSPNGYANFKSQENSVVSIDDQSPMVNVPGRMLDFQDNSLATFMVGDASYCWDWNWQVLNKKGGGYYTINDIQSNSVVIPPGWEAEKHTTNDFAYTKLPFAYLNVPEFQYAHWIQPKGSLSPIVRMPNYPVQKAFRTAGMIRGDFPYGVVVDDIKKDDQPHHYVWTLGLEYDIQIQKLVKVSPNEMDIYLTGSDPDQTAKKPKEALPSAYTGQLADKQSMLLVRVLNYETDPKKQQDPEIVELPNMTGTKYSSIRRLIIPSDSVSPNYKVLLYPYHNGAPLPATTWNANRTALTVKIGNQEDTISFSPGSSGITHVAASRNGVAGNLINLQKDTLPISD